MHAQIIERLDGVAAVVGGTTPTANTDVVLRSDVELRARMALSGHGSDVAILGPLPSSLLAATLQEIIGELLIAREAKRLQVPLPPPAELQRDRQALLAASGGPEQVRDLLDALSADMQEIEAVSRRRSIVGAFLKTNLVSVTSVTEAELARAATSAKATSPQALELLRFELNAAALERAVQRWVAVLRARIPVRVYVQY
jgi:hypothetical protein